MKDPSPIKWEKVEYGYVGYVTGNGLFTIVESFPDQWTATDWSNREQSPRLPSDVEARSWCENRLPSDPPAPDSL
jgi:hypothetical protein